MWELAYMEILQLAKDKWKLYTTLNMLVSLNGVEYFNLIDRVTNSAEFLNFFEGAADATNMTTLRPVWKLETSL